MAGWTKVSSASNGASGTTLVLGSIPAGSFIRVCTYGGTAAGTVSDGSGDTGASSYALAKSQANTVDGGTAQEFWLYPTVNTASRTITAGASVHIAASWWTPPTGTTAVSVSSSNSACTVANATSISSGNVTAALGDLVAGFGDSSNTFTADWTAGGTSAGGTWATDVETTEGTHVVYAQFVVATAGGTYASQPVYGSSDALASVALVYTATGGATVVAAPSTLPRHPSLLFRPWARHPAFGQDAQVNLPAPVPQSVAPQHPVSLFRPWKNKPLPYQPIPPAQPAETVASNVTARSPSPLFRPWARRPLVPDVIVSGVVFNDSGTGTITLSGSGTESHTHSNTASGSVTLSGTGTQSHTHSGSGSGTITLSGTGTQSAVFTDSRAGTITLSGTGAQSQTHTASGAGSVTLSGAFAQSQTHSTTASGTVTLSGFGSENYVPPGGGGQVVNEYDQTQEILAQRLPH